MEPVEEIDDVGGEADRDAHVGEGVLEDKIPADDPGDEFAEDGVGVGVGGAGDGDHAGELSVTEAGEATDDGDEDERDGESGTGTGTAGDGSVVKDEIDDRRTLPVGDLGRVATDGGADDSEDS